MLRLILAIIAFTMALAVLKMVIVALIIAGLIFRTQITIGLLCVGGLLTLIAAAPFVGVPLTGLLIWVGVTMKKREAKTQLALEDPDQE